MPLPRIAVRPGVVQAVLGLRRRVLDLADLLLPPEVALWDYVAGMQRTKLATALVGSGLADALNGERRDAAELARELDLDAEVTHRVLRAAAAARLVVIDKAGRARLTRTGAPLSSHHRHSIASWVGEVASARAARGYEALEAQLRGGAEPSGHRRAFGNSLWEYFDEHPDEGARFGNAMRAMTALDVAALARAYPWPQSGVVCDVAGGIGTLLAAILKHRSALDGILIDAPDVLAEAEGFLHSCGLSERVERRPGDLFGELDARADVYVLKWILHDWNDDACRDILARVRATMPAGSTVVVIDQHHEPDGPSPVSALMDLHMLVECEGGRERSAVEVHALMKDAGLSPGQVRHVGLQMLVEGVAG